MSSKLKIAYLTSQDPLDRKSWSGSHYSIFQAIKKHVGDVEPLGPYQPKFVMLLGKLRLKFFQILTGKRYNYAHSKFVSKAYARYFDKKLSEKKYDLIVATSASCEIAYLKTNIPIVYIADSSIGASLNYHNTFKNVIQKSLDESLQTEKSALDKAKLLCYTTEWAAKGAMDYYGISKDKICVLPFGANFEETPSKEFAINRELGETCKLLFIGVHWGNKGGEIAYNTLMYLLNAGIKAELTICGCVPPEKFKHDKIKVIPFLNKNIKEEREQLYNLYKEADFFILPTRFEAYGLVFCEASAYGLPSLATRTGGVPGVVTEGVNGFLFDEKDRGEGYAKKIIELYKNKQAYKALNLSSRRIFEEKLNWNAWANGLLKRLEF